MRTPAALWLGLALAASSGLVSAQHGFVPPPDRALHERLAEARVVAFATIDRVDDGRIAVRDAEAVLGTVEPSFEVKRSPGAPPPWIPGQRVLLLLSGARSPYRWVEKPIEAEKGAVLDGPAAEARWRRAVRALDSVRSDGEARRDLYASWCDGDDEALRVAGLRGLLDLSTLLEFMDEDFARDRVRVATDESRALPVRRAAARVAARHATGIAALLAFLAEAGPDADPEIAEVALRAGLRAGHSEAESALSALLRSGSPELRSVALGLASLARGPEAEQALAELAVGHSQEGVRSEAMTALKKLRRNRGG